LLSVERPGRLWIVEGATDAAAMLSLGFDVVGVPSAGGAIELVTELARRILPQEIAILADGDNAGRRGAERIADALMIVAPCRIVSPPQGIKDARAWVVSGVSRAAIESAANVASVRSVVMEGE
jgi:DNA primase